MTAKLIQSGAVQADADVCNALSPPTKGCHAGGGIHIVIPPDWQERIAAGQAVPGCTYAHLEPDGSLYVDDLANARIADQAVVGTLSTVLQTAAGELQLKLTTVTLATVAADVTKGSL